MRKKFHWFLLLAFLGGGGGCALLSSILGGQKPELTFRQVRFTGWSFDSVDLELVYDLHNPYDVPLQLAEVVYQLEVEGRKVLSGSPKEGLRIAPRRKQTLTFPATVHFLDVIPSVKALFTKDALGFRASGRLGVDTPLGVVALPLSKSGEIAVPKLPKVEIAQITAPKITSSGATFSLGLMVENRNGFPLPLDSIDWAFQVDSRQVAKGRAKATSVAASQRRRIDIPIDVGFAGAGQAAQSLLSGRKANLGLNGNLRVGKVDVPVQASKLMGLSRAR